MKVIINNKQMPIPKKYSQDLCNLVETILEKNPNIRPSIVEISEMDIVRRNFARHVTNNEKLKENKAKFESGSKEFENKFKNGIENNYPSNATMSTNPEILSPQVNNLSNSIINLQNFVLVKEKFNTYKVNILLNQERYTKEKVLP
jgi:serine/threonine protein kinase